MKWYRISALLIAAAFLASCAFFKPARQLEITPPDKVNEVRDLLSALHTKNDSLVNFKGIGNIRLSQKGRLYLDQRVAWIGENPVKLSIAVLVSGYPAIKLATDGEWLYYLESDGHETVFKKMRAGDPSLKQIISIPISFGDMVLLLSGRVPMPAFDSVAFVEEEANPGFILVLEEKWWGIRQKIFYDENRSQVYRVDVFQRTGAPLYRAEMERLERIDGFEVPFRLKLSTDDGHAFQLDIERCWVNVELPPSAFVLTPPE